MAKIVIDFEPEELFQNEQTLIDNIVKMLKEKRYHSVKISKLGIRKAEKTQT